MRKHTVQLPEFVHNDLIAVSRSKLAMLHGLFAQAGRHRLPAGVCSTRSCGLPSIVDVKDACTKIFMLHKSKRRAPTVSRERCKIARAPCESASERTARKFTGEPCERALSESAINTVTVSSTTTRNSPGNSLDCSPKVETEG